ncbi:hypothetical protein E2C01_009164 [Portunus trituberculatus]|uniref:Uncharacterized protein n=1 Tax=Portunus trituberculatus TaxID=210409 RepID=A0A5B7D4M2_PORTR|nr:hypothetical protein [Portunus trituberculatus]
MRSVKVVKKSRCLTLSILKRIFTLSFWVRLDDFIYIRMGLWRSKD